MYTPAAEDEKHSSDLSEDTTNRLPEAENVADTSAEPEDTQEKGPGNADAQLQTDVDTEPGQNGASVDPRPVHGWKWLITCLCLYSAATIYGLDTTIAADVQPAVVKSFGSIEKIAWVGVGFPLGSVATILPLGYAYGQFNVKRLFLGAIVLFEAGSALCGGANNMNALIIGRVMAGVGGAAMYLGVLNYISIFTSERERPVYMGISGIAWGLGIILGPVTGGGFATSSATWRWAFYMNPCIAAVSAPGLIFILPSYQHPADGTVLQRLLRMDWLGITLSAGMYTTFVLAFTFGGTQWAWGNVREIVTLVICVVITIVFGITQAYAVFTTKERRIFPCHLLRQRSMIYFFIQSACSACGGFVAVYYIPLFFQFVRSDGALKAAVRLLPFVIVLIFCCLLNGALMPVVGYYMPWYLVSGILITIGGVLMFKVHVDTPAANIYGYSVVLAAGGGCTSQIAYSAAVVKAKRPQDVTSVIGLMNTAQLGGIVITLAIAGTVFQNAAHHNLQGALSGDGFSNQQLRQALAGTQSAVFNSGSAEIRSKAIHAITEAMGQTYILVITAGALMTVTSLLMKRERLFMKPGTAGGA